MAHVIPVDNWRKGSQWLVLTRKHAEAVVNDTTVFPMLQQHCRLADPSKEHNCIPDKHYVQTLLAVGLQVNSNVPTTGYMKLVLFLASFFGFRAFHIVNLIQEGLEGGITRRSLTYSSWDLSSSKDCECRGWHLVTYKYSDATPMLIQSMKEIDNIYYETEYRREWCSSKGKPSACFLFARKFTRLAALRLLNMCKASLVLSKLPLVKKPSDLHSGVSGAILKVDKKKPLVIVNKVDYAIFTVGPFAFETKCYH
ncbi:hypothetical protein EZV62_015954 [Acer yangbiense]|uniref:Uncharacterized protein n=1 Tax=Acer yangbiense TaxID=1000413 RepID=A0A5C7HN29_9ROSI|nr:hypothetical protein EZV62_015954 [Acer yangbiense]